jgi:hypothetical protein
MKQDWQGTQGRQGPLPGTCPDTCMGWVVMPPHEERLAVPVKLLVKTNLLCAGSS